MGGVYICCTAPVPTQSAMEKLRRAEADRLRTPRSSTMPEYGTKSSVGPAGRYPHGVVDKCWSVPVASACTAFLSYIAASSYGYLYVLFIEKYGIKREEAAWPQSSMVIAGGCAGLLVSLAQHKLSLYQITLVGGMMACAGLVASAFAPNITWLTVTFGVVQGTGMGMTLLGIAMYLLLYFDKYKATATAIKDIGTVAAGATGVPMTSYFMAKYGLQGCLLLTGGVMMHMLPVIMLVRHPRPCNFPGLKQGNGKDEKHRIEQKEKSSSFNGSTEAYNGSDEVVPDDQNSRKSQQPFSSSGATTGSSNTILSTFAMPAFYVVALVQIVSDYTTATYTTTIVDYGVDKGTRLASAKNILMYNALGQAVGRLLLPFVSDKIPFSRSPIAVACFLATAASFFTMPSVSKYEYVVAIACVAGMAQGYIICIRPLIQADHIGLARFSFCCGVAGLASIPVWLAGPTILGYFRDVRGSYDHLYFMLAGVNTVVGVLLAGLTCSSAIKRGQRQAMHVPAESEHECIKKVQGC